MSTLVQIESAVAGLPPQEQWTLLTWLQAKLAAAPKEAASPRNRSQAELDQWLAELDELKLQTSAGKAGMPLEKLMDEIREERF